MDALEILLVEDNEGDVELVQRAFRDNMLPCAVSVVNDGMEAMDFLLKRGKFSGAPTPRLIFLDLNMPRMDGKKFLEAMKADAQLKATPVVMLTSSASPSDIRECYERYASGYIVKPFDGKEFASVVKQAMQFWSSVGQLPT